MVTSPNTRHSFHLGLVALVIAVGSIALPISGYVDLYNVPPGTACRPMSQVVNWFVCGVGGPLAAIVFGLLSFVDGRVSRILGVTAILLSFIPFPLYYLLFHWIVNSHHLIMEP
jgi:hypothetical protein